MNPAPIVARTLAYLQQIPDEQLAGPSPLVDALETLSDDELVTTAQAVAITAQNVTDKAVAAKAVRVFNAAQVVAKGREKARATLAASRPFPAVFAASKAGAAMAAVAARRDRLGTGGGSQPAGGTEPTRRAMGPLTYYNLWVAQGKWGRQGGDPTQRHFGIKTGPVGITAKAAAFDAKPRDAIEAAAMGDPNPLASQGMRGLGSLAGLNLGKFFQNLVKDIAPVASLATAFIPGIGTAAGGIVGAIANAGKASPAQLTTVPVQGPPLQTPAPAASGPPAWVWPAVAAGGLLLLAGRK